MGVIFFFVKKFGTFKKIGYLTDVETGNYKQNVSRETNVKKQKKLRLHLAGPNSFSIFAVLKNQRRYNMNKSKKQETYHLVNSNCEFEYSEYIEWCEINNIKPAEDGSSAYWEWCADEAQFNYDCDMSNLMYSKLKDRTFIIEGTLGLWWGRPTIEPLVVNGIVNAIKKCIGRDTNDVDAELNTKDGVIYVNSHHHDGTNCLTLKMLNKNGENWIETALKKWRLTSERGEDFELNNHYWTKITDIKQIWK